MKILKLKVEKILFKFVHFSQVASYTCSTFITCLFRQQFGFILMASFNLFYFIGEMVDARILSPL